MITGAPDLPHLLHDHNGLPHPLPSLHKLVRVCGGADRHRLGRACLLAVRDLAEKASLLHEVAW